MIERFSLNRVGKNILTSRRAVAAVRRRWHDIGARARVRRLAHRHRTASGFMALSCNPSSGNKFKLWRWLRPRGKKVLLGRRFVPPHNGAAFQHAWATLGRPAQPQRLLDIIALRACCSSEASTRIFSTTHYLQLPLATCGGGLLKLSQHSRRQGRWRSEWQVRASLS